MKLVKQIGDLTDADGNVIKQLSGKLDLELVPAEFNEIIAKVFMFGLSKGYERESWKTVPADKYLGAKLRHGHYMRKGEEFDPESGLPHAYHEACNALMYCYLKYNQQGE